ncbi:MAG: transporter [Granulosicoccus sp.]
MHVRRTISVLICMLSWFFVGGAFALTNPGSEIVNTAKLSYLDVLSGELIEVESNTSRIIVSELQRFSLTASQTTTAEPAQKVSFTHTLTNIGNVVDSYELSVVNSIADDADLTNLQLIHDLNNNGQIDLDESPVEGSIALLPAEHASLIVSALVPNTVSSGDTLEVVVSALSLSPSAQSETNRDEVSVQEPALLEMALRNSPECTTSLFPEETITYRLDVVNRRETLPVEREISIDGRTQSGVLVEVDLPAGLKLVPASMYEVNGYQATTLVQQRVADEADWMSLIQWNAETSLARVGFLLPATHFEIDELMSLSFQFVVDQESDEAALSLTVAGFIDLDSDQIVDVRSNSVCNEISQPAAAITSSIRFLMPSLTLQQNRQAPTVAISAHYRDAEIYRLSRKKPTLENNASDVVRLDDASLGYDVVRDGVYLELISQTTDEQKLLSTDGTAHVAVELLSRTTLDSLLVVLQETEPGSGVYRSLFPVRLDEFDAGNGGWCPVSAIDAEQNAFEFDIDTSSCVLRSSVNDTLNVRFTDLISNVDLHDEAIVEPASTVFDANTLSGVEGATVTLYVDGRPAKDLLSDEPLVFFTDELGRYVIPALQSGIKYSIGVDPPPTYLYPSRVPPDRFESLEVSDVSYGEGGFNGAADGRFVVSDGVTSRVIDIPLDPSNRDSLLSLEKRVLSESVEPGEAVSYQLVVSNRGDSLLEAISILDTPAYGFKLITGSVALNTEPMLDPMNLRMGADENGQAMVANQAIVSNTYLFELGDLEAGQSITLSYQLLATAAALQSDGVNSAVVSGKTLSGVDVISTVSRAQVQVVRSGVLSDKAIIFGKVFVDSSCDYIQNKAEWPIGGVKLYLQDGSFVVTDEDGQFSFYGMNPGLHVLKLDTLTLPKGLLLKPIDNRNAADAESRFVELTDGDFHRADFAANCPSVDAKGVFERLKRRNQNLRGDWLIEEASRFNPDSKSRLANDRQRATADGDLSSGLLGEPRVYVSPREKTKPSKPTEASPDAFAQLEADVLPRANNENASIKQNGEQLRKSSLDQPAPALGNSLQMGDPKELSKTITQEQAVQGTWLWPQDELSLDGRFMAVVRSGANPVLYVNDQAIPNTQIGERIGNLRERAELIAWYGVQLTPGINEVQVRGRDGFGNERILAAAQFKRPAAGVQMLLRTRQDTLPADGGRTMLPIDIVINDANGYPANGVYFVTLETSAGDFLEEDLQAIEPGIQVRIENGRGKIHLRSSELTGRLKVSARAGGMQATLQLVQVAAARPLLGAGLVELGGRWNTTRQNDDRAALDSGFDPVARAALFLKGRVKNDMTLTLSYDSEKNKDTELLRDLNPNEQYPTLGDASVRGFEAQSRSKLYAKLERERHSVMWGDYLTDSRSEFDSLARIQRTLTGFNAVYDNDKQFFQLFAARQSEVRASEEVRGNGTAMLFRLSGAPLVANSEVIEIVIRDRDNPGLVLSTDRLQRFSDYSLDSFTGLLRFSEVVPSVDENLNPVFVRASYDKKADLDEYTIAGVRWQYKIADQSMLGFSITEDQNPLSGYTISGVQYVGNLTANTFLNTSAAEIKHRESQTNGQAQSVSVEHYWSGSREHRTTMNWIRADSNFDSPDSGVTPGRQEWRLEHQHPLSETLTVNAKSLFSESTSDNTHYGSAGLLLDKRLDQWSLNAGARRIWSADGNRDIHFNTIQLGAERRFKLAGGRSLSLGMDAERDIADSQRFRYGVESRVQMFDHVHVYGRYEREQGLLQQSLNGSQEGSRQWVVGVESDVLPSTQLYSEYRMRGSFSGRDMETASGVRGRYVVRPGLSISPALEIIDVLQGSQSSDSIAISLGMSDTRNPNRKLTAQAEIRDAADNRYYGFRATLAQRLNLDWTTLVREEFTRQSPATGELTARHRFTLGLARRPKLDNQQHGLYLFNWKEDFGPEFGQDKRTYLLSTHQNYQFDNHFTVSGRLGAKWQTTNYQHHDVSTRFALFDARAIYDLNRRWELDVRGGWLGVASGGDQFSLGAGVSWIADRNVRLGLAYNVVGFKEEDLDEQGFNRQGIHLGLQFKFDEDWFRWLED